MTPDLVSVLDVCLARLRSGEAPGSVLADYPEHTTELASLVKVALAFQPLRETVPPDPAAVATARRRFLAEAARLRQAQFPSPRGRGVGGEVPTPVQWLRDRLGRSQTAAPTLRAEPQGEALRWAATLAMAVVLFALVSGGAVIAANDSLPGDPLYPVKRAAEVVQLTLALDDAARAEVRLQQQARRQAEIKAVVNAGREAGVAFEGIITQVAPGSVAVAGFPPVLLDTHTVVVGALEVGARVQVSAMTKADGTLHAGRIMVVAPPPTATPAPLATADHGPPTVPLVPAVGRLPSAVIPSATWTAVPTASDTPVPSLPVETLRPVSPTKTPTLELTLTWTPTRPPTATATWTPTVAPTATPVPTRLQKYRFEGRVEAIAGQVWTIAGQQVIFTDATSLDESQGKAEVGALVSVVAEREPDGRLVALKITVKQPRPVEFSGPIDEIGQDYWIVGGRRVTVNTDTKIEGQPEVGAIARVEAVRLPDNSLRAVTIVVEPAQTVQFAAPIVSISPTSWVIASWTVYLDTNTVIEGEPSVGAIAEVTARLRTDGSLLATHIRVRPRPTLTLSPTPPPSATPTPQPSATPTATETPGDTATPTAAPEATATPTPELEQGGTGTGEQGGQGDAKI